MDWSSAGPLWQRQSAGESRWARTEAVGEGRATSPTSLQPLVPQMTQLLVQLADHVRLSELHECHSGGGSFRKGGSLMQKQRAFTKNILIM